MVLPMHIDELVPRLRQNRDQVLAQCDAAAGEHDKRYQADKWSVREILAHLADVEMINLWRFGRAVAEPGANVEPFDQSAWAQAHAYATRPVAISRALFVGARDALIHSLAHTAPGLLARGRAVHAEKGDVAPLRWAEITLDHADHHVSQIVAARRGLAWVPTDRPDAWQYTSRPRPK